MPVLQTLKRQELENKIKKKFDVNKLTKRKGYTCNLVQNSSSLRANESTQRARCDHRAVSRVGTLGLRATFCTAGF